MSKPRQTASMGLKTKTDKFTLLAKAILGVECVPEYRFHPVRRWRFDYAIPKYKIALEVEGGVWTGGRHIRAAGFLGDMEKYNTAAIMGWQVLRVTPKLLICDTTIEMLRAAINQHRDIVESSGA